jgi:hypothetical protein
MTILSSLRHILATNPTLYSAQCFDEEKVMFFGGKRTYDKKRSLSWNFFTMCHLSWFKQDSVATLKLKEIIKQCDFTTDDGLNKNLDYGVRSNRRKQQLAKLETVKLAIDEWRNERGNSSSRCELVNQFEKQVDGHIHTVIWDDWHEHNRQPKSQRAFGWTDARWDNNVKFDDYLPDTLKPVYQQLKQFTENSSARNVKAQKGSR